MASPNETIKRLRLVYSVEGENAVAAGANKVAVAQSNVTASAAAGALRTRLNDQIEAASGMPKAAMRPNVHASPKASVAPTGPQAFAMLHGVNPGSGSRKELAADAGSCFS